MIQKATTFSPNMGHIFDFSKKRPSQIFNEAILPKVNSFVDDLGPDPFGDEAAALQRQDEQTRRLSEEAFNSKTDQDFVDQLNAKRQNSMITPTDSSEDYNSPVAPQASGAPEAPSSDFPNEKLKLKLSNYGYDSDSSPDYNSNVARIGHANNKLSDGVSAALTKSLATRYGLKTGDMFEAMTSDGQTLKRRYDDTVPTTYKGKALPETVDLYEIGGNNKFSGVVTGIRPLKKQ